LIPYPYSSLGVVRRVVGSNPITLAKFKSLNPPTDKEGR